MGQGLRLLALLSLFHVGSAGFSCSGMGRRYCDEDAVEADKCPETCLQKNCRGRKPVQVPQSGSADYRGGSFTFDDLVKKGLYEHVYISGERLCVGHCWYKPWKGKCRAKDNKACVELDCEHDEGNKYNSGNRFVGCHRDEDGNEKKPFHLPTCKECKRIFKKACKGKGWKGRVSANADATGFVQVDSQEDTEALSGVEKYIPFDSAPSSWQIMFLDEYKDSDSMVVPVVNVILQFGNAIEDFAEKLVVAALAEVAGVEEGQALLLHTYDLKEEYSREVHNSASNATETQMVVDYLLTVSVGIVAHNPEEMAEKIRTTANEIWSEAFAEAGNMTFLPRSLSAEIKHISSGMVSPGGVDSAEMINATALDAGHMEPSGVEPQFGISPSAVKVDSAAGNADEPQSEASGVHSSTVIVASAGSVEAQSGAFGIRSSAVIVASMAGALIANFLL